MDKFTQKAIGDKMTLMSLEFQQFVYSTIESKKSPASGAGKVSKNKLMSEAVSVCEIVYA